MLHAGLDLSRKKLDVCLLSAEGEQLDQIAWPPDGDALRSLARRIEETYREPVRAVIESMTGARFVHDTLELADVLTSFRNEHGPPLALGTPASNVLVLLLGEPKLDHLRRRRQRIQHEGLRGQRWLTLLAARTPTF
jgi:hypothetical protein